jgi:predicted HAD superfamily Cof-like phosphohydrolase
MTNPTIPKFKSFEAAVLYFNGMYKLPIAPVPTLLNEQAWQEKRLNKKLTSLQALKGRMEDFFQKILQNELREHEAIIISMEEGAEEIDILTDLADLLGDIQVYCASEMARFGLPNNEVLRIIMDSNFSKLGADGNPIYDENGKVCKGPNYWKPEPAIKALLLEMQEARYD